MNIRLRDILTVIIVSAIPFTAHAVRYCLDEMDGITTPTLSNALVAATEAEAQRDYSRAVAFLDDALAMSYAPEFAVQDDINGPLELQILSAKALLMSRPHNQGDSKVLQLAENTLHRFKEVGENTRCSAYIDLYRRIIEYYTHHKNYQKAQETADAMLRLDSAQMKYYLTWAHGRVDSAVIQRKITLYEKEQGRVEPYMAFMRIRLRKEQGENVFNDVATFIRSYPTEEFDLALQFLRQSVDTADIHNVREYHTLLTWWALNQPSDEAHVARVAQLMNERKKLEILIPDVVR